MLIGCGENFVAARLLLNCFVSNTLFGFPENGFEVANWPISLCILRLLSISSAPQSLQDQKMLTQCRKKSIVERSGVYGLISNAIFKVCGRFFVFVNQHSTVLRETHRPAYNTWRRSDYKSAIQQPPYVTRAFSRFCDPVIRVAILKSSADPTKVLLS